MAKAPGRKNTLLTVTWKEGAVIMIDQTRLPTKLVYTKCENYQDVVKAIKNMVVRGAPAIGVSAAFGLALAALNSKAKSRNNLIKEINTAYWELRSTRPTAINLFWGLDRVMGKAKVGNTPRRHTNQYGNGTLWRKTTFRWRSRNDSL
jgi:methylthioribose-1-phosphate isomerase